MRDILAELKQEREHYKSDPKRYETMCLIVEAIEEPRKRIAELEALNKEARKDKRMLDWLIDGVSCQTKDGKNYFVLPLIPMIFCGVEGKRQAIKQAMEESK